MKQLLPLVLSILTIIGMWLIGNKNRWDWIVGLVNQLLWISFAIIFKAWGLLPLSVVLIFVYTRNLYKWKDTNKEIQKKYPKLYETPVPEEWKSAEFKIPDYPVINRPTQSPPKTKLPENPPPGR